MTRTKGAKNLLPPGTQKWWPAEEVLRLHERIRELEAEVASMEPTVLRDLLARAEKAEAELDTLRLMVRGRDVNLAQHIARAEKAEKELVWFKDENGKLQLRVAELEEAVAHAAAHSRNKKDDAIFMRALRGFQIEAREREAE